MQLSDATVARMQAGLASLREDMAGRGLDAVLIVGEQDVRCLAGCFGHDTRVLVTRDRAVLISDRRYEEYLSPWQAAGVFGVEIAGRGEQVVWLAAALRDAGIRELAVQSEHTTLAAHESLSTAMGDIRVVPAEGLLRGLRICKSAEEIVSMRRAIDIQCEALAATLADLRLGMTEGQVAARLIYEMRLRGAEGASFEPIVGSGANASVIHHVPGDAPVEPGVLLIDWGARVDGVCSDLTRTFFLGTPDPELKRMYTVVAEAQRAAIEACTPGTTTVEVDAAAREVIAAAGWEEAFAHGVGHGLGRDVHELPFMGAKGPPTPLEVGMVVTIEPGVYIPGLGGVRIEDDVHITEQGPEVLSASLGKDLESAVLPIPQGGISG
jgi:Xaa-Pro aminopeptidase